MDLWEELMLLEGLNEYYEAQQEAYGESGAGEGGWDSLQNPPRNPLHGHYPSRHDKMATGEELMALGINYTRE